MGRAKTILTILQKEFGEELPLAFGAIVLYLLKQLINLMDKGKGEDHQH